MARRVLVISLSVVILSGLTIGLSLLFGRELERRTAVERELAHLPLSDMPTGLPNRRRFDKALEVAWKNVRGTRSPLSLLAVSADHFKRYNDNFCHVVGNEVLQGLARCLAAGGHQPSDLVSRIGGEEVVMLLPEHNRSGALRVAARIHAEVSKLPIPTVQIVAGWATVSIGLASMVLDERQARTPNDLYDRADAALNETTATGCNRTYCAEPGEAPGARQQRKLRVVGAT